MSGKSIEEQKRELEAMKIKVREQEIALAKEKAKRDEEERRRKELDEAEKFKKEHPYDWKIQEYEKRARSNDKRYQAFNKVCNSRNAQGLALWLFCLMDEMEKKHEQDVKRLQKEIDALKKSQ